MIFQGRSLQAFRNSKELSVQVTFGFLSGSRNFCKLLVLPAKFLFCTDMTGSFAWPIPAPRLHIGDCFKIHNFHCEFCDLLLSSHQHFLHEVWLRQCVFCTGPTCNFGPLADLAMSVFRDVSINTVFTQIHTSRGCGL